MLSAPDILQLATPEAAHEIASFEESQVLGAQLSLTSLQPPVLTARNAAVEAVTVLRSLVSTTSGARGWFVILLTDERYDAVFEPPLDMELLRAIEASPEPNLKLLIMNIAMSTATELVHMVKMEARTSPRPHASLVTLLGLKIPISVTLISAQSRPKSRLSDDIE